MKKFNLETFNTNNTKKVNEAPNKGTNFLKRKENEKYTVKYTDTGVVLVNQFNKEEFNYIEEVNGLIKVQTIQLNAGGKCTRTTLKAEDVIGL